MAKLCQDDLRTVLGNTLATLANCCNLSTPDLLTSQCVKRNLTYFAIPDDEEWRRELVLELLQLRDHDLSLEGFSEDEVTTLLNHVCTS